MKITTSLLYLSSFLVISFSIEHRVIADNISSVSLKGINSTSLVAQNNNSETANSDTQKAKTITDNKNGICIFKLCLAKKKEQSNMYQLTFWGHTLLAIVSIVTIVGTFVLLNLYAIHLSKKWLDGIRDQNPSKFSVETTEIPNNIHKSIKDNPYCEERLKNQLSEIQIRIVRHKEFMLYFYRQHFLSIYMTSGLALIAGICLIFIAEVGIGNANPALINIFITTASAGLLYQRLPAMFQQELNREANRSLFLKYSDLGNIILSYLATGTIRNNTPITNQSFSSQLNANKFVHFIDQELARFNQLPIEKEISETIKSFGIFLKDICLNPLKFSNSISSIRMTRII
ncbi:MAG: hypothetical protein QNJ18_02765 [Xenococcaceae cyanobacterium MO_167.B52]|nr:hypothetical protein [Xenococcaceae cyanobacterium MO_167.B52]